MSSYGMNLNFWKKEDSQEGVQGQATESQYSAESETPVSDSINSAEYYNAEPADPEKARFYNNVSRWALYVGVFLVSLLFLPWTSAPLELNKQMLLILVAGIGLVAWLLGIVSSGYLAWRNNNMDKGIIALLGAFALVTFFSTSKFTSLFGSTLSLSNALVSIIALTVLYFLIVNNVDDRGKTLRAILGLSIVLALVYGLLQVLGIYIIKMPFSSTSGFNSVGSANVLGIIAAISLAFFSKSRFDVKWLRSIHLEKIGVVLSLLLLIVLNWWVLWSVAIAGMVAMIVFENLGGGRFRMTKLLLPMTVVVLGVFMMVVNLNLSALKRNLPVEVAPSFNLSKDVTVSAVKEKMVFGYGSENYAMAFDKYGAGRLSNTSLSDARFLDSNSEVMTLITQGGLVMVAGLLFFLFCLGMVFWKFKKYAEENQGSESMKEDIGVLSALAAVVVAFFLYPFNLTIMTLFYVFMGLVVLVIYDKDRKEFNIEERTSLSLASSLGFIGGLIMVLVGVYFGATIYMGDVQYARALQEADNNKQAPLLVEAINWNGNDDRYYRSASQTALTLLADEIAKKAYPERNAKIQNYVTTAISLGRRATEISPQDATNWANLGFVYQNLLAFVDGVDKLSEDAYLKAAELRPGDPSFSYRIGMLYLGKIDLLAQLVASRRITAAQANSVALEAIGKAEENLKKAIEQSPNFGLAIYNLGVIYDRQGKVDEAIKQLEKIIAANSDQPGLAFELGLLYYRDGRKDEAVNALEKAVVLAPDYSNARWYLALIQEERGNVDGAIEQLERILSVDVNKDNATVMAKLEALKAGQLKTPPGDILDEEPLP